MMSHPIQHRQRRAFTLIELLTVIAIIGILAAILIPVVGRVRESAHVAKTTSNLRQLFNANKMHAADYKGLYVPHTAMALPGNGANPANWYNSPIFGAYIAHAGLNSYLDDRDLVLRTGRPNANGGDRSPSLAVSTGANSVPRNFSFRESDVDRLYPSMVMFGDSNNHWIAGDRAVSGPAMWNDSQRSSEVPSSGGALAYRYSGKANVVLVSGAVTRLKQADLTVSDAERRKYFPPATATGGTTTLKQYTPPY